MGPWMSAIPLLLHPTLYHMDTALAYEGVIPFSQQGLYISLALHFHPLS